MQDIKKHKIELLAPAKNYLYGITAINFGADAVYIGANKFGARDQATNQLIDIEKLIKYAHKFDAKVYVTLNTIIYEDELSQALNIIDKLYQMNADAIIIQDFGILEMKLPPIPIHASTQTHNYDIEKIIFLQKVGFSRVILARELSLTQIKYIADNTNIELECFVHGAVCVSFSGQCYMSYKLGHRSGNRGQCAQPCRLQYDILDKDKNIIAKNKHILSLKDMNRSQYLLQLIEAGCNSFKIEGRMKDINYLKNNVAFYRQKIDNILSQKNLEKTSIGVFDFNFIPNPDSTFNRQYTDYFLLGKQQDINAKTSKPTGQYIGKISNVAKDFFQINSDIQINNGDGLCFINNQNTLSGIKVNTVENNKIFPNTPIEIKINTEIYRNYDHNFIKKISNIENCRYINIYILLDEMPEGFFLYAQTTNKKYHAQITYKTNKQIATNRDYNLNIIKQLDKTGDTIFKVTKIDIAYSEIYFLSIKEINEMRRNLLTKLYETLGENYKNEFKIIEKNDFPYYKKILDYKANIANSLAKKFFLRHQVSNINEAYEINPETEKKEVMITKFCIKHALGQCEKYQKNTNTKNLNEVKFIKYQNNLIEVKQDCTLCQNILIF